MTHCIHCVVIADRQKRREEKKRQERRAEVTFRPNDSIILTDEVGLPLTAVLCCYQ